MVVLSFILAANHYRIKYRMKELVPYFILSAVIIVFSRLYKYQNLTAELLINTVFIVLFILFAQFRDHVLTVFFRKDGK
jgi:hypothetical protein